MSALVQAEHYLQQFEEIVATNKEQEKRALEAKPDD
jgi:hypothetical protein